MTKFAARVTLGGTITPERLENAISSLESNRVGVVSEVSVQDNICSLMIDSQRFPVMGDLLGWFKDRFPGMVGDQVSMRGIVN